MADSIPSPRQYTKFLLLGGNQVNENALLRFYVLHCVVLQEPSSPFLPVHIWRVRKDGGLYLETARRRLTQTFGSPRAGAAMAAPTNLPARYRRQRPPFTGPPRSCGRAIVSQPWTRLMTTVMTFPHLIVRELVALMALSLVLVILAVYFDARSGIANPQSTRIGKGAVVFHSGSRAAALPPARSSPAC